MTKNVLATIGLAVVIRKGIGLYLEYRRMARENQAMSKAAEGGK